jgi:hypothetical protein
MSIVSTLALLITAATAKIRKIKPNPANRLYAEIVVLQARIDNLNRQTDDLIADLTRQRDAWQRVAIDYQYELFKQREASAQQMAQMRTAQQLGAQNLCQALDAFVCNCAPARHDVFLRG